MILLRRKSVAILRKIELGDKDDAADIWPAKAEGKFGIKIQVV